MVTSFIILYSLSFGIGTRNRHFAPSFSHGKYTKTLHRAHNNNNGQCKIYFRSPVFDAVEFAACNASCIQIVHILKSYECRSRTVQIFVRWEFHEIPVHCNIFQKFCAKQPSQREGDFINFELLKHNQSQRAYIKIDAAN